LRKVSIVARRKNGPWNQSLTPIPVYSIMWGWHAWCFFRDIKRTHP